MTATGVTARERLDEALRDYIAEASDGAILTDWVTIAAATTIDDIGPDGPCTRSSAPRTSPRTSRSG